MQHPTLDILIQMHEGEADGVAQAALRFKREVLPLPVWILGTQTPGPYGQTLTNTFLEAGNGDELPHWCVYVNEADAIKDAGETGYFVAGFRFLMLLPDSSNIAVSLIDGEHAIALSPGFLLSLRGLADMDELGTPMNAAEIDALKFAANTFAIHARAYCVKQAQVECLHLALLIRAGVTAKLLASLSAEDADLHGAMLAELGKQFLPPRCGFKLERAGVDSPIEESLKGMAPCYSRHEQQDWWSKLKRAFNDPKVPVIQTEGHSNFVEAR